MFDFIQILYINYRKIYRFQHNLNSELFNKIMIFFTILGDNGIIWIAIALILFLNRKYRKNWVIFYCFTYYMCTGCKCYFKASYTQAKTLF